MDREIMQALAVPDPATDPSGIEKRRPPGRA